MLLLRSNGTLLHMKDCIITFVKLIISKKHNFILYNALTNRDSPNFPLPSNPLPQIVTSNPRLQPDTDFAVDMFPYKTTELFQELGFYSQLPKKPGNTPLSGTWFYFLDIKTTVSTCVETSELLSFLLVGLRKYVQRLISLWKHINGLQLLHCMFLVQLTSRITYLLQRIISMINCSVPSSNCLTPLGVKPCRK